MSYQEVIDFWFGPAGSVPDTKKWFKTDESFDKQIKETFGSLLEQGPTAIRDWCETPTGRLAFIIVFDQFSRNVFRESAKAFEHDPICQSVVMEGREVGHFNQLDSFYHQWFYLLPLMHAENLEVQKLSVLFFKKLANDAAEEYKGIADSVVTHAVRHHDEILRFGRFPYRNSALNRDPSEEELQYVKELMAQS
jgi:uncharacterized protein (DUF924 family)